MAPKTYEQRLFGAACLKLTLARTQAPSTTSEIYEGTLKDLNLTDEEVEQYLAENRQVVLAALEAARTAAKDRS